MLNMQLYNKEAGMLATLSERYHSRAHLLQKALPDMRKHCIRVGAYFANLLPAF